MKKLLELKSLDTEVRELLQTVETPAGIYICLHMHYLSPTISIYLGNIDPSTVKSTTQLMQGGIVFEYDLGIDEQIVDEIIAQIEKVMQ